MHLFALTLALSLRERELPRPLGEDWVEGAICVSHKLGFKALT